MMSDDHSARAGSLNAHLMSVSMEIDDDDEDIVMVIVEAVSYTHLTLPTNREV